MPKGPVLRYIKHLLTTFQESGSDHSYISQNDHILIKKVKQDYMKQFTLEASMNRIDSGFQKENIEYSIILSFILLALLIYLFGG